MCLALLLLTCFTFAAPFRRHISAHFHNFRFYACLRIRLHSASHAYQWIIRCTKSRCALELIRFFLWRIFRIVLFLFYAVLFWFSFHSAIASCFVLSRLASSKLITIVISIRSSVRIARWLDEMKHSSPNCPIPFPFGLLHILFFAFFFTFLILPLLLISAADTLFPIHDT